jgi:hypothetical protein
MGHPDDPGSRALSRGRALRIGGGAVLASALAARGRVAHALPWSAPVLRDLRIRSGRPFAGDHRRLATVDPRTRGRRAAVISFTLDEPATVKVQALRTAVRHDTEVWRTVRQLPAGEHHIVWRPSRGLPARTYLLRTTVRSRGRTRVYGDRPPRRRLWRAPVVRLLGVEAVFASRSYAPGRRAALRVSADARRISLQIFRSGAEEISTNRPDAMSGVPVSGVWRFSWRRRRDRPHILRLRLGNWPSGLYFARLQTEDGRLGFAPLVIRPRKLGEARVAVIVPTNTWQAYNFRDADGDGWGDTWYAGGSPPVWLNRPFLKRGVPPRFKTHDRAFHLWLHRTGRQVDMLCDDDLERFASGDRLRQLYDLVVFPGHSEYMTRRSFWILARYRDLGGNLLFLSANNFFWCVTKRANAIRRRRLFRELGTPEAKLMGVQYRANDSGKIQRPYAVRNAAALPWLWNGTGLSEGMTFGEFVGGFGTEIDATTPDSPAGTVVVAEMVDIFGPGRTAQMAYYESRSGARVFSAGALDFGGSVTFWPMRRMLENVWRRLTIR